MVNQNGIVRVKPNHFGAFYNALNYASQLSGVPVQVVYELWLGQVMEHLTESEILDELLTLIDDMENE